MASSSSSSSLSLSLPSPSLLQTREYDVFTSFHGPDVRKTILSHVRREFKRIGINMFIDDKMKRGEFIGPVLKEAIRGSKIAVVLLSKNYASSSWCLDELVEIMNMKESGQKVITIFYGVKPTDVRKQKGDFGKVFKKTCKGKGKEKVHTWTKALEVVATIAGYDFSNCDDEATLIGNIATEILNKLNLLTPSHYFERFIGMEAHMRGMNQLMRLDLDEVRIIGIWGPPGIGKTTIARFLFDQLSGSFQNSAFILGIRGKYPRPCLDRENAKLKLQEEMFSQVLNEKDIEIPHLGVAQQRLRHMTVFLVLDDVDQLLQLQALAENVQWFGPRSRIIITTEDRRLLKAHKVEHIYTVSFPSNDEALEMFCMYAFNKKTPEDGFDALAREITYIVGELPLALEVIGSHFRGLSKEEWPMEVSRLRKNLHGDIESILKFSYDALCDEDKDLFLHIACFFNLRDVEDVEKCLGGKFKYLRQRLYGLEMKALISIIRDELTNPRDYIEMHILLVKLGKEIVRKQSVSERQFLVSDYKDYFLGVSDYEDSCEVYTTKTFEEMYNLQYIRVDINHLNIISSTGPLTFISPKLRVLKWSSFPMTCLHFPNDLEFLVELRMSRSKLEKLWKGTKLLRNLKLMDLSNSENLKELPNLSMATNLEEINLSGCSSLVELHPSIGNLTNLHRFTLKGCSNLMELPPSIGNLTNLFKFNLKGCSSLVEVPPSIGNLTNLQHLDLRGCLSLVELPSSARDATKLNYLNLCNCSGLLEHPSFNMDRHSLHNLFLSGCSRRSLPSSINNLTHLESLRLNGCSSLVSLPQLSDSLRYLDARNCESLEKLDWSFCNPGIMLNFGNCFKLNKEARDLLIEKSTVKSVVLPGKEVPACFTYRGYGSSVTVKLNQKHLPSSTKFKACLLFEKNVSHMKWDTSCVYTKKNKEQGSVSCCIRDTMGARGEGIPISTEHLYIFEVAVEEVTSTELLFDFCYSHRHRTNKIKECGIIQLLEHHVDEDYETTKRCVKGEISPSISSS